MLNNLIQGLIVGVVGAIFFVVARNVIYAQDYANWTAAERAIVRDTIPIAIALLAMIGIFLGLQKLRAD